MYANTKREANHEKTRRLVNAGDTRLKRERGISLVESMLDDYRSLTERYFRGLGMDRALITTVKQLKLVSQETSRMRPMESPFALRFEPSLENVRACGEGIP
jgi:hypothetical protein